jgi:hypothetical protein
LNYREMLAAGSNDPAVFVYVSRAAAEGTPSKPIGRCAKMHRREVACQHN